MTCVLLLQVPGKFRYPFFTEMHWYVLDAYVTRLLGGSHLQPEGLLQQSSPADDIAAPDGGGGHSNGEYTPDNVFEKLQLFVDTNGVTSPLHPEVTSHPEVTGLARGRLSECELRGVKEIVYFLQDLSQSKRCVPKDMKRPEELLHRARVSGTGALSRVFT